MAAVLRLIGKRHLAAELLALGQRRKAHHYLAGSIRGHSRIAAVGRHREILSRHLHIGNGVDSRTLVVQRDRLRRITSGLDAAEVQRIRRDREFYRRRLGSRRRGRCGRSGCGRGRSWRCSDSRRRGGSGRRS